MENLKKIPDNQEGLDFRAWNEFEQRWYEIEVKSGDAQLTEPQEERRKELPDGTIAVTIRITQPVI